MRFSFLGIDDAVLRLARAVCSSPDHEIVSICADHDRQLLEIAPTARYDDRWELLLDQPRADAVIVAGDNLSETRNDQLRKLVQAGVPLLLIHPACDAMVGYELEMICADTGGTLFPYVPGQRHALFVSATQLQNDAASPLGDMEQIVVEHFVSERSSHAVLASLANDTGLLLPWMGRVEEVSAFGPANGDVNYSTLSVNMMGSKRIPVRWSAAAAESDAGTVITLVGTRGRAVLSMLGKQATWTLRGADVAPFNKADTGEFDDADASAVIADFDAAIAGHASNLLTWPDACRALEVSTAVRESLRRGRKIKLYDDQYSEQQTFKGKMAAAGCLLLMVVLLVMFGFALFDGVMTPFRDRQVSSDVPSQPSTSIWLRLWPAYPLIGFLLLQLLRLVFIRQRPAASEATPTK